MIKMEMLKLKETIDKGSGERVIDLAEPTLVVDHTSPEFVVERVVFIDNELAMRPDLVSLVAYGNDSYIDIILKANQISNPFAINIGDRLIIPNLEYASSFYRSPEKLEEDKTESELQFLTPDRASEKDKKRKEKLKNIAKNRKNGSSEIKPPNQLKEDEKPFEIENGRLKLGNNGRN